MSDTFGGKSNGFGAGNNFRQTAKTIGSIKNMQVNYGKEHTFFSSKTHTFPRAIESKKKVLDEIDLDLLGTKTEKWNPTVAKPKSLQD